MYWATVPRADPHAKAREFRLNSALPPQRVLQSHAANESSGFGVGRFAACFTGASRPPSPMGLQTDAMPSDDSIRLDDDEMVTPIREPAADQNPESTVRVANLRSHLAPLQNDELLAQTQIFSHQTRLGFDGGGEAAGKETNHILIVFRLLQSDQRFSIDPRSMPLPDNIFAPYSGRICTWDTRTSSASRTGRFTTSMRWSGPFGPIGSYASTRRIRLLWSVTSPWARRSRRRRGTGWDRVREARGRSKVVVVGNHDITGHGFLRVKVWGANYYSTPYRRIAATVAMLPVGRKNSIRGQTAH